MVESTPLAQLGQAFYFTQEDLRDNRARQLSSRQRQYLTKQFVRTVFTGLLLLFLPALVGVIIVIWSGGDLISLPAIFGYVTGLILLGFYLAASYRQLLLIADLRRSRVESITGSVERQGAYCHIGRHEFLLEQAKLDLIQTGLRYTFYYLPISKHIVGVEFAE